MIYYKIKHWYSDWYSVHYKFSRFSFYRRLNEWYCPAARWEPTKIRMVPMTFTITAAKAFCENTTEEKLRLMQDGGKVEAQESLKRIKLEQDQAKQALRAKGIVIR